MKIFTKIFTITFIGLIFLELLSWIVTGIDDVNKIFFLVILLLTLILSIKKLEWGIYIVLAELFIGSKGYLLEYSLGDFSISLRLGLFLVVFLAFIVWIIRDKQIKFFKTKFWKYYTAFMVVMAIALLIGYFNNNDLKNIFFDWNGYLFFGLLFPITQAIVSKKQIQEILQVLWAAVCFVILKTLGLLFLFSQENTFIYYLAGIYKWIRDTGVGEITTMENGFVRIFFQSHIYIIIIFFIGLSILSLYKYQEIAKKKWWAIFIISSLSLLVVFLSYSRSFWVGFCFVLMLFFTALLFILKIKFKKILAIAGIVVLVFIADYALALGIVNFPLPGNSGVEAGSLLKERTKDPTQEAAGSSRMELLRPLFKKNLENPVLGSGFGTTVTYETNDPRYIEMSGTSTYTTYAFEWGYLDLWLKFGAIGSLVYIFLLWQIFKTGFSKLRKQTDNKNKALVLGSLLGFTSILVIHFFTPYLNHPLGIGWILIVSQFYTLDA